MTDPLENIDLSGIEHRPDPEHLGVLVFWNLPDVAQRAEDSTAENDAAQRHWRASVTRTRPSTEAERILLGHVLGHPVPSDLQTKVIFLSNGVRRREFYRGTERYDQ